MDCKLVQTHLDAYVDGELEPTPVIEFERHLDQCSDCRNELALARMLKQGVREGVARPMAPPSLRVRMGHALDRVDQSEGSAGARWTTPLAAAAALALAFGGAYRFGGGEPEASQASLESTAGLLSEIVAQHRDQLPVDVAPDKPEQVTPWFRGRVEFRVRSVDFGEPQVRFAGARFSHVGNQRAARFYYDVGDSRVTVVAFKEAPPDLHRALRAEAPSQEWRRERIGSRVLTYRNVQGYTVPVIEHDGVVYAFTGDLDQQRLLHLVASARLP